MANTEKKLTASDFKRSIDELIDLDGDVAVEQDDYDDPLMQKMFDVMDRFAEFDKVHSNTVGEKGEKLFEMVDEMLTSTTFQSEVDCYSALLKLIDDVLDSVEDETQMKCQCHEGCDACCKNNLITITYFEAFIIKSYLWSSKMTRKKREMILRKCAEQDRIIRNAGITTESITKADNENDNHKLKLIKKHYHQLKLPCVFLDNGGCLIHDVRPLDCMAFRQYASSFFCEDAFNVNGAVDYAVEKAVISSRQVSFDMVKHLSRAQRYTFGAIPTMMKEVCDN